MAKTQKSVNTKCRQGFGQIGALIHSWLEWKMAQPLWKMIGWLITYLSILLPCDPETFLGIHPIELKTYPRKNLHTDVL